MDDIVADIFNYAIAVFPTALAMLSVPPLTSFDSVAVEQLPAELIQFFRFLYNIVPPALLNKTYVLSLVRDSTNSSTLTPYFTHMFVHHTYKHLLQNLDSFLWYGFPVFCEFGGLTMNLVFLGGGIAGSLDYNWQQLNAPQPKIEQPRDNNLTSRTAKLFDTWMESTVMSLNKMRPTLHMGASAGVYSLLGSSFVLMIRDIYLTLRDIAHHSTTRSDGRKDSISYKRSVRLAYNLLNILPMMGNVFSQLEHVKSAATTSAWDQLMTEKRVGHEAHLQGFLFGASVTCGLLMIRSGSNNILSRKNNNDYR